MIVLFKKKKGGSALVLVVCMFAILSIIIVSIMAMTTTGYKLRKTENSRIENFYGADSGIEIAYAEMQKVISIAIEEANKLIDDAIAGTVVEYPTGTTIDKTALDWKNKLFKQKYKDYISANFEKAIDNVDANPKSIIYASYKRDGQEIQMDAKPKVAGKIDAWELKSNFKDKENKQREVKVEYELKTPEYGVITANKNGEKSNLLDYAIATDGNLYLNTEGDLDVYGDIWVNGRENPDDRFDRGIHVNASFDTDIKNPNIFMDWRGRVITRGTFNLKNANINLYEDIYARDLNIQARNRINAKSNIYVYNDLIFNSDNSILNMKDYYGLNDITNYKKPDGAVENENALKTDRSSAMIINSKNFGNRKNIIADNLYLAGTAYLGGISETDNLRNYESGESIVINRNTQAYTSRNYNEEKYLYSYKKPLHIIDKIYRATLNDYDKFTLDEKVQLVENYYEIEDASVDVSSRVNDATGIEVKEHIYSTGVSYANGKAYKSDKDVFNKIKDKQDEFVKEVFLRNSRDIKSNDFWNKPEDITVEGSINWGEIQKLMAKVEIYNTDSGNDEGSSEVIMTRTVGDSTDYAAFQSQKTVENIVEWVFREAIKKAKEEDLKPGQSGNEDKLREEIKLTINDVKTKKLNLIFNLTDKDISISDKENSSDANKINIKYDELNDMVIIISKGSIEINAGKKASHFHSIGMSSKDLTYNIKGSGTLGSFSNNKNSLKYIYENLFKLDIFEGILDSSGSTSGNSEQSNTIIEASDLIKQKKWNLSK